MNKSSRPEYQNWRNMKQRCHNPNNKDFAYYGARGISVCDEWRESFLTFLNHIGDKPGKGFSVDRIDNDGDYKPGNVRWSSRRDQSRNTRNINKCGYTGVSSTGSKTMGIRYKAYIYINNKKKWMGTYDSPSRAGAVAEQAYADLKKERNYE